ncbi:hypothetical protein ACSQ67_000585 [Phaseolus vulgaris]
MRGSVAGKTSRIQRSMHDATTTTRATGLAVRFAMGGTRRSPRSNIGCGRNGEMINSEDAKTCLSFSSNIVSSCAKLSSLFQGQLFHARIIKDGFLDDIFVGSSLKERYNGTTPNFRSIALDISSPSSTKDEWLQAVKTATKVISSGFSPDEIMSL